MLFHCKKKRWSAHLCSASHRFPLKREVKFSAIVIGLKATATPTLLLSARLAVGRKTSGGPNWICCTVVCGLKCKKMLFAVEIITSYAVVFWGVILPFTPQTCAYGSWTFLPTIYSITLWLLMAARLTLTKHSNSFLNWKICAKIWEK